MVELCQATVRQVTRAAHGRGGPRHSAARIHVLEEHPADPRTSGASKKHRVSALLGGRVDSLLLSSARGRPVGDVGPFAACELWGGASSACSCSLERYPSSSGLELTILTQFVAAWSCLRATETTQTRSAKPRMTAPYDQPRFPPFDPYTCCCSGKHGWLFDQTAYAEKDTHTTIRGCQRVTSCVQL